MRQLRGHLDRDTYVRLVATAGREGYELWAWRDHGSVRALAGVRAYTDLVRGTHLYVDDLVTDSTQRSRGYGAKLLNALEALAREKGLPSLRLCCAFSNPEGRRFYAREEWTERAWALVKAAP